MERFETFTVLLNRISRNIRRIKNQEMTDLGLRSVHISCLYYLHRGTDMTAAALCDHCEEDKATISRALVHLEEQGYLAGREAGKRYKTPLRLTDKGRAVGARISARIEAVLAEVSRELLELVGLPDKAEAYPAQLSGGQQQRVAIARALATHPKVLLCDEATSALDPNTTRQILELIRDINKKLGITVVVITHQMSVVKEICTHVAILDEGRVAESGLVGTVFAAPKSAAGRRLVFPGGADAQVYDPAGEKLVRLVFKDAATTSIPMIARLASEEGILCNVISASTQKLSETVYGSMMLGIPSNQFDKAVAFLHNVANVQVEEVE